MSDFNYSEYDKNVRDDWFDNLSEDDFEPYEFNEEDCDSKFDEAISKIRNGNSDNSLNKNEMHLLERCKSVDMIDFLKKNVGDKPINISENAKDDLGCYVSLIKND